MRFVLRRRTAGFGHPDSEYQFPVLAACCPMGLQLPVIHRENLSATGVRRFLTLCCPWRPAALRNLNSIRVLRRRSANKHYAQVNRLSAARRADPWAAA